MYFLLYFSGSDKIVAATMPLTSAYLSILSSRASVIELNKHEPSDGTLSCVYPLSVIMSLTAPFSPSYAAPLASAFPLDPSNKPFASADISTIKFSSALIPMDCNTVSIFDKSRGFGGNPFLILSTSPTSLPASIKD